MKYIDLRDFYQKNVSKDNYYYQFYDIVMNDPVEYNIFNKNVEVLEQKFEIFDEQECIKKFKEICMPDNEKNIENNISWFYLLSFFLYKNGYHIDLFPNLLQRPPKNPRDFIYNEIRNYLIINTSEYKELGKISWESRRVFIHDLKITKDNYFHIDEEINEIFTKISTRNAGFDSMATDEKLEEIANFIEHILKTDKKYEVYDYSKISFNLIYNDLIHNYRNLVQCFRHTTSKALEERSSFSNKQKNFLINYGILICELIHTISKTNDKK